jgi:hypothetical protein
LRDLDRIQTCNLLSRNQMRYSVAPRGLCEGKYILFYLGNKLNGSLCHISTPSNYRQLQLGSLAQVKATF